MGNPNLPMVKENNLPEKIKKGAVKALWVLRVRKESN